MGVWCGHVEGEARHRSRREIEVLVARLAPKRDAPAIVRRVPAETSRSMTIVCARPGPDPTIAAGLNRTPDAPRLARSLPPLSVEPREERDANLSGSDVSVGQDEPPRDGS